MSVYVIMTAMVACVALCYWYMSRQPETEGPEENPETRGEEKYGGVLPFAATCVAVVLIVAAVCTAR